MSLILLPIDGVLRTGRRILGVLQQLSLARGPEIRVCSAQRPWTPREHRELPAKRRQADETSTVAEVVADLAF
jgi:hypothetical protein